MSMDTISATDLDKYVENKDVIIIDVRSKLDFGRKHICNAINIQLDDIENISLDKQKLYVLYCERGATSLIAATRLQRRGYMVKSVVGGINAYHGRFLCKD